MPLDAPAPLPLRGGAPIGRLLLLFAAVVLCFTVSTLYAQGRAIAIDTEVQALTENGIPSIDELTSANDALRDIEVAADQFGDGPAALRDPLRARIEERRRALEGHLARYRALPQFAGERTAASALAPALREFDLALAELFAAQSDDTRARLADDTVRVAVGRASGVLRVVVGVNLAGTRAASARITALRSHSTRAALVLDSVGVVLAVVAALVASLTFRRHGALEAQTRAVLAGRASELERFAQHVAHDLVSPLSALSLRLDRIQRDARATPGIDESVRQAKGCVFRAQRMTRGIFEFARATLPSPGGSADVSAVARGAADDVRDGAGGLAPEITIAVEPAVAVRCSSAVLASIVTNLLDNAVKHATRGTTPEVTLRASARDDVVRVEVEDHGPGVPPGAEAMIFEPYARVDGTSAPGLGLGLATVKRLVERHGGRVGVTSRIGLGATFWIELPRA